MARRDDISNAANAYAYERFVTTKIFTKLPAIAGHRGAYLLKRTIGDEVEFIAVTPWRRRHNTPRPAACWVPSPDVRQMAAAAA